MNLKEKINLLIEVKEQIKNNRSNNKLLTKANKLKYFLIKELENSPFKTIAVKSYLEKLIAKDSTNNLNEKNYMLDLYNDVDKLYVENVGHLNINTKKELLSKNYYSLLDDESYVDTKTCMDNSIADRMESINYINKDINFLLDSCFGITENLSNKELNQLFSNIKIMQQNLINLEEFVELLKKQRQAKEKTM